MPNWCSTTYKIVGKHEEVTAIHDLLNTLKAKQTKPSSFVGINLWEVVESLGGDLETISCRGSILSYKLSDEVLQIDQQTAWNEQADFRHFLEKVYPHIKIYYQEEEPMEDIFYTNDHTGKYFPERFFLDSENDEPEYFNSLEDTMKRIEAITGTPIKTEDDMNEALDLYLEAHGDDVWYSLHKFEVIDD